jgi:hypothetical protein
VFEHGIFVVPLSMLPDVPRDEPSWSPVTCGGCGQRWYGIDRAPRSADRAAARSTNARVHYNGGCNGRGQSTGPTLGGFGLWSPGGSASKAICTAIVANPFDMNVRTFGSLFDRLSHQRSGVSTQPPSVLGIRPSKLPRDPPNRLTSF